MSIFYLCGSENIHMKTCCQLDENLAIVIEYVLFAFVLHASVTRWKRLSYTVSAGDNVLTDFIDKTHKTVHTSYTLCTKSN